MYKLNNFSIFLLSILKITLALDFYPLSDDYIDYINQQGKWKAGRNFDPDMTMTEIQNLFGSVEKDLGIEDFSKVAHEDDSINSLPKHFDAREKWPNCPSIKEIRDQGSCGSCWVFGAVEAMTDRVCIYSNGTKNFHFSAEDVISCAVETQCKGNQPSSAWKFWQNEGIVSGGNYESNEGCKPYWMPPCAHVSRNALPPCHANDEAPSCSNKCRDGYNVPYSQDKRRGKSVYAVKGEGSMRAELFKHGPMEVSFTVYYDFLIYKGDVYQHLTDSILGYHAGKLVGWGEENGKKYWLVANSWNTNFGLDGFFKILRGENECNIEGNMMIGGEPDLDEY